MPDADTFPKLLDLNATRFAERPAIREKQYGIWQSWTWAQARDQVRTLAAGLAALGLKRGDKLAIVGDNRPRLYWSMVAAQAIGAIPLPVYQDAVAAEMQFVLDHGEARFAIAEDQEQVDKLVEIKNRCPRLEKILYDDGRGLRHYEQPYLLSLDEAQKRGEELLARDAGVYDREVAKGKGDDVAIILYTSGTTGQPKGVVLSFDNLIITSRNSIEYQHLKPDEEVVAYLPMAWIGDNIFSLAQSYVTGFCVNCPESSATVLHDLREIGPTYFYAPPRIWENLLTTVMIRMEDAGWLKRRMFHYFMKHARRVGMGILDGRKVGLGDRLLYRLGSILVYGPLKNTLGFSRVRQAYTAGEAIGPDIFEFFRSLGLNIKQLYGSTEASVFVTVQPDGGIKPDTVGVPVKGVELKIADNGEVMFRSPGVFREYYKNPAATAATKTPDGWVHTGDAGVIGADGQLKIVDRAKDVGRLKDGTIFAPKFLENKLKFFPSIKEAVAFGHDRDYVTAMISIDLEAVGNWAERRNIAYSSYQELAAKPEVYELVQGCVEQVNRDLADDPELAGSQIRRFVLLHKELDADDGELTRTRKVRRAFIADRYRTIVDALYSAREAVDVEAQVKFEDGRTGVIKARLAIRDAPTVEPVRLKMAS
ncbi:MAG TPA: AMP-binding protein [Alphaproteobacteria bacterium]